MKKERYTAPVIEVLDLEFENIITDSTERTGHKSANRGTLKFSRGWWYTEQGDMLDLDDEDE